ncbi:MAG: hypothetical protein JXR96_18540 [Deltaproteobacteria bacterium]|nr:hypothetical protein [Deltaproteobacteria bacterium]
MRACFTASLVLLAACAAHPQATGPERPAEARAQGAFWPPAVQTGKLPIPAERTRAIEALEKEVEAALNAKDAKRAAALFAPGYGDVENWAGKVFPHALAPFDFKVETLFPAGAGVVCMIDIFMPKYAKGGYARYQWGKPVYLGPGEKGRWCVQKYPPPGMPQPRLVAIEALVWLAPEREWMRAEAEVRVEPRGQQVLIFELAAHAPHSDGGLRVSEVRDSSGRPLVYMAHGETLAVQLAELADSVELRFRYEGEPPQHKSDYLTAEEIHLRGDGRWLPLLPDTQARFDLTVRYPEGYTLFGQGDRLSDQALASAPGWREARWTMREEDMYSLYGAREYVHKRFRGGQAELTVALWPRHKDRLEKVGSTAARLMEGLEALLGPYPFKHLRVVETGYNDGRSGYGALTNVSLGWRNLAEEIEEDFFAHEFSHGWWGGQVPSAPEASSRGQWSETLAEYTCSLVLDEAKALEKRKSWSEGYARLPAKIEKPMMEVGTRSAHWGLHHGVTYQRGALVMTALEDRLGREAMKKLLRAFIRERSGKQSTWRDFLACLTEESGREKAEWLLHWLETKGAPALKLEGVKASGEKVSGAIAQADTDFTGEVQLGFYQGDALLGVERVPYGPGERAFELALPAGAELLVVDPLFRTPRRYDPNADRLEAGQAARLAP